MGFQHGIGQRGHRGTVRQAFDLVALRVITDVLELQLARQFAPQRLQILLRRQLDRAVRKLDDIPLLEKIPDLIGPGPCEALRIELLQHDACSPPRRRTTASAPV